jgi:hypothetical protein
MGGTVSEGARPKLTQRDRFWLRHHKACVASGKTARAYAKAHGLSVSALYQSRKRLRSQGKLAKTSSVPASRRGSGPRFAKVATLRVRSETRYRVRLASGALVEWEGCPERSELEAVLTAVSRLA